MEKEVHAVSVHAWGSGTVLSEGWQPDGYGNYCIIEHDNGTSTLYGHMVVTPLVSKGQRVTKGQTIGLISSEATYVSTQVHYATSDNDVKATATK